MDEDKFNVQYMKETGLVAVSMYGQTVELCLEDIQEINELVEAYGKEKIANREDFLS